jgi:hypothetical protein
VSNLAGLHVKLDRPTCCQDVCVIHNGKGPHIGELRCASCDRHRGWLDKATAAWLESVVVIFGRPTVPIQVTSSREVEVTEVSADERRRRLYEIARRIEMGGFEPKNFFLSSPPMRDWYREQQRLKIARLIGIYKITAHDLVSPLPAVVGADSEKEHMGAIKQEADMADMTRFGSTNYLGVDDVREGPIRGVIAAVEVNKKIDRPTLIFTNGLRHTLNKTNVTTLLTDVGTDDESWCGETVELTLGQIEYQEKMVDTVVLSVIPRKPGVEKVKPPKPVRKKTDSDIEGPPPF